MEAGTITHRLINFCWFWFKWGLILCVIGAALAVPYFYHRMDDEIRRHAEARLAKQYPDLQIKIRSAVLVKGEGIEIRGLSIIDPAADGPGAELLNFDECFFRCSTDLQELVAGEPEVTQVVLRRPTLRMTRRPDGTWSSSKLLPLPKQQKRAPELKVENGTIEIFDPLKSPATMFTLRDVNLTLVPPAAEAVGQGGEKDGLENPSCASNASRGSHCRKLQGTLTGDYFRQLSFEGQVDPHRPEYSIRGMIEGLDIGPELRTALPASLPSGLSALNALRGQGELSFQVTYNPSSPTPLLYDVSGRLVRGRIDDPRLPNPLTDVRAAVRATNEGFRIDDFSARSNQAKLCLKCEGAGFGPACQLRIEGNVTQFDLNRQFVDVLPEKLQEQWHKYRPEGLLDADVKLSYDGKQWRPEMHVRCLDVSFSHHKFPYRLEHGRGTVTLKDDLLQTNLMAFSGNQAVRINAELRHPGEEAWGWIEAKGEELPLDQKLIAALPERSRNFIRSLDARGTLDFEYRLWRNSPEEKFRQQLGVRVSRCMLRYEKFPYPIGNIRGSMEMMDGNWVFRQLEGSNGVARITAEGSLTPTPDGNELLLRLAASDVPLEDELRDALQPGMRQVWAGLRPRGTIDLTAEMRYVDRSHQFDLSVRAQPRSENSSIEPLAFPYRLEKLQGVLTYRAGRVTIERFKAEHGPVKVAAGGFCGFLPDGGWHLHLQGITMDRLRMDREVMQALPARLRKGVTELNPSGPMSLRGTFDLARSGAPGDPVRSRWDLVLGLQQATMDSGLRLENINGSVSLAGGFDGQSFHTRGELALDSLSVKDHQFTQVMGPIWIDDQQALFGSWVDKLQRAPGLKRGPSPVSGGGTVPFSGLAPAKPRPITARLFGGAVYGDAWVALGSRPRYGLQATLVDAELARCAQEVMAGKHNLRGRIVAGLELRGAGRSRNDLAGHGNIQLSNANVYELPVMVAMLKLLRNRPADTNAFSRSDMDFRIEGEHIYFDKLDFHGDAFSLRGNGEMNSQNQKVQATFTATVGRGDLGMPVLQNLFTGASQQLLQVHVGGTLQNPDVRKEAFPGVNQAIQQFQERR